MTTFEIRIYFDDYCEKYERVCEDYSDARCEAEEIIQTLYTKNGHLISRYDVEEITD